MINIYLIEDEFVVADSLKRRFQKPGCPIKIVGYSHKVDFAIPYLNQNQPDIIVLDLFLRRVEPLINFRILHRLFPKIPIIIYSSEDSLLWKWMMILEGAMGYVVKGWEIEELKETICKVKEGQLVIPGELDVFLKLRAFKKGISTLRTDELLLIRLRYLSLRNNKIAPRVGMTIRGVEKKIQKLFRVFDVSSMDELIRLFYDDPMGPGIKLKDVYSWEIF